MLFLDGVYTENKYGKTRFQRTNTQDQPEIRAVIPLLQKIPCESKALRDHPTPLVRNAG